MGSEALFMSMKVDVDGHESRKGLLCFQPSCQVFIIEVEVRKIQGGCEAMPTVISLFSVLSCDMTMFVPTNRATLDVVFTDSVKIESVEIDLPSVWRMLPDIIAQHGHYSV